MLKQPEISQVLQMETRVMLGETKVVAKVVAKIADMVVVFELAFIQRN